jgi:ABC-2 type transport system ATP-binding protein
MSVVEARQLKKEFVLKKGPPLRKKKEIVRAVDGVSFSIGQGEIFSLLGPNGAGKTTTIKMLATLLIPTSGTASVKGHDIVKEDRAVRKVLTAVLPGERTLYWKLTVRENLYYFGSLYGLKRSYIKGKAEELLRFFGLEEKRGSLVEKLSTGQRQKVVLSRALLPDPDVILLDEPTLGLDPVAAVSMRGLIKRIAGQGKTILLTTHYMYEADELSSRVAIIDEGKFVCLDTPASLKKSLQAKKILRITVDRWDERLSTLFSQFPGVQSVDFHGREDEFAVRAKHDRTDVTIEEVSASLAELGVSVRNVTVDEPTLEDVFIEKTGESISEKEGVNADAVLA